MFAGNLQKALAPSDLVLGDASRDLVSSLGSGGGVVSPDGIQGHCKPGGVSRGLSPLPEQTPAFRHLGRKHDFHVLVVFLVYFFPLQPLTVRNVVF